MFTVHELKRPARNAAEFMAFAADLQASGIYDPAGLGAMLFAALAVAARLDHDYIRDKTLEGQQTAAARGRHSGRPEVIDGDMLAFVPALRDKGVPVPDIATKITIKTGKNTGQHPSVYRPLADADEQTTWAHAPTVTGLTPTPAHYR